MSPAKRPPPPRGDGGRRSGPLRKPPGQGARAEGPGAIGGRRRVPDRIARALGGDQVEGRRAVRELLAAGRRRTRQVFLSTSIEENSPLIAEILDLAEESRVEVHRVSRERFSGLARSHAAQGVLAQADPLQEAELDDLCRPVKGQAPFLVVVDGVTDPQNLGALLRTADAAGATGIVLPRHRAVHISPAATKAAAGAIEYLAMTVVPGIPAALSALEAKGIWRVGLDADGDRSVFDLDVATEPIAIVVGAEGTGLARLTRARCDVLAAIPQRGHLPSLNAAAAGAVAFYEVARRRTTKN